MSLTSIYLFLLLFWGDGLDREPGDCPSFKPMYFAFFLFFPCFFFFFQMSFPGQPKYLSPTVSGERLSATGSSESAHPKREAAAVTVPVRDGTQRHRSSSGTAGQAEPGNLCAPLWPCPTELRYPPHKTNQLPPLPCLKKQKNCRVLVFFQAAFCRLYKVLSSQPTPVAPRTSACSWVTPKSPGRDNLPGGGEQRLLQSALPQSALLLLKLCQSSPKPCQGHAAPRGKIRVLPAAAAQCHTVLSAPVPAADL